MMNEEVKAAFNALNGMEEAYQLACANGYAGEREDFAELCVKAAEETAAEEMDLDDMAQVAGGGLGDVVDWVKEHPVATAGIVAGSVALIAGVSYGVYRYTHPVQLRQQSVRPVQNVHNPDNVLLDTTNSNASFLSEDSFEGDMSGSFDFSVHNGSMDSTMEYSRFS